MAAFHNDYGRNVTQCASLVRSSAGGPRMAGVWLWVMILLCCAACGTPVREPLPSDAVILAFGDSLTAGKGVTQEHSYPSVLGKLTGLRVVNEGVSGEITAEGLQRLPRVLSRTSPNLVILMHGGNDVLRNQDLQQTKQNLAQMIELSLASGAQVLLVGIPEKRLFSTSAPLYQALADQYELLFESEMLSQLLKRSSMKSDLIHFNRAGYKTVAQRLHGLMSEAGLLKPVT